METQATNRRRPLNGPRSPDYPGMRPRLNPNKLRDWLEQRPRPMLKIDFAEAVGCSPAYLSQLLADDPPWPGREIARRIAEVTKGAVTPNDWAGYPPTD